MAKHLRVLRSFANAEDNSKIVDILNAVSIRLEIGNMLLTLSADILQFERETSDIETATPALDPDISMCDTPESREVYDVDYTGRHGVEAFGFADQNLHVDQQAQSIDFTGGISEVQWLRTAVPQTTKPEDDGRGTRPRQQDLYVPNCNLNGFNYRRDTGGE
jgi:hypothetical protein